LLADVRLCPQNTGLGTRQRNFIRKEGKTSFFFLIMWSADFKKEFDLFLNEKWSLATSFQTQLKGNAKHEFLGSFIEKSCRFPGRNEINKYNKVKIGQHDCESRIIHEICQTLPSYSAKMFHPEFLLIWQWLPLSFRLSSL
jgi:hypothetical protein